MNKKKLYTSLAYLGALPFIISAVLLSLDVQKLFSLGSVLNIANSYAMVIVVFMSGIHWGTYLCDEKSNSLNLLLISNVITVFSWFAFLLLGPGYSLIFYIFAFMVLLWIDIKLYFVSVITKDYLLTRCFVTLVVIASLTVIVFNISANSLP